MSAFTDTITAAMVTTAPPANAPGVTMPNGWRVGKGDCGYFATHPWLIPEDKRRYGVMTRVCKDAETLIDEVAANNMFWETIDRLSRTIQEQRQTIDELRATGTAANKPAVTTSGHAIQLPARLTDAGWELIEDTPGTWIATHPRYGATAPTIFSGNRPDLAQKYMVEKIAQLMPPDAGLKVTAISHKLASINELVYSIEAELSELKDEVAAFANVRCIGAIRYRVATSGTYFVYTDHPAGATCPVCGTHPEGKRYRKYWGEDETATADNAKHAVNMQAAYVAAVASRDRLQEQLRQIERLVWRLQAATVRSTNGR
jgi:hypothetical protein